MGDSTKKTHWIKTNCPTFGCETGGRSVAEVKNLFTALDPVTVRTAATSYTDASAKLVNALNAIDDVSAELAKIWKGESSVKAQKALHQLHDTIVNLAAGLDHMGKPLETLSSKIREHKEFVENATATWSNPIGDPGSWDDSMPGSFRTIDKGWEWGSQDELAGHHLKAFTEDLRQIHTRLPDYVEKELPDIEPPQGPQPDPTKVDLNGPRIPANVNQAGYDPSDFNPGQNGNGINQSTYQDRPTTDPRFPDGSDRPGFPGGTDGTDPNATDPNGTDPNGNGNGNGVGNGTDPNGNGNGVGNGSGIGNGVNPTGRPGMPSTDPNFPNGSPTDVNGNTDPNSRTNGSDPRSTFLSESQPRFDGTQFGNPAPTTTPTTYSNPTSSPTTSGTTPVVNTNYGSGYGNMAAAEAAAARGTTLAGTTGMGAPMVPLSGVPGGGEERTNETSTWLKEEDDCWVGTFDNVVNDTIC